jgi:DNA-binding transcriptional ArsR family regulator
MSDHIVMSEAFSVRRTRFAMVPEWVDEAVTDGTALRVYVRLARKYVNTERECHPSQRSLADELKISVATVENALRKLREVGAVVVRRTDRGDGKFGRNEYWLPLDQPSSVRAGADQAKLEDQPSNPRGGPALTDEGSITRPRKATRQKTPAADAPDGQIPLLPGLEPPTKEAPEEKEPTLNQRAVALAQKHYDRLGGMGNVPAWMKIIRKALDNPHHCYADAQVDIALQYLADRNWTLTEERLANTLRGGPKPASQVPAGEHRKHYQYRADGKRGMELQVD